MDLQVGNMLNEIARELHQNGTPILLQWNAVPSGATPDPVDGSVAGLLPQTKTLRVFVHQVQAAGASSVRQFNEVEVGDLILDFAGDALLPEVGGQRAGDEGQRSEIGGQTSEPNLGLAVRDLVFVVNGKAYVAKQLSDKLAQSWDVTVQGRQLFRSVLVRVAT